MPPQRFIEGVGVAFVEGVFLDEAPAGFVGTGLVVPLGIDERAGLSGPQRFVGVVIVLRRAVAGHRSGRWRAVKLLQELRRQRGRAEGLASLSGVRRQFDVDGHRKRRRFRLFGWFCRRLRELLTLGVKAKEGCLAGAAVIDRVGCVVGAVAVFQQAG